jgi:putative flippase GtrA
MRTFRQFLAFASVGAVGTAAHYVTLVSLVELGRVRVTLATAAGAIVGAMVGYLGNYHWTFASQRAHHVALPRFAAIAAVGALLNTAIMALATRTLPFHYLLLQMGATGIVLLFNFAANRHFTFTAPAHQVSSS